MSQRKNPIATIEMEGGGTINIELFPSIAPNTVANFIELASSGFYDATIFHRVIESFMLQGGDPTGTGTGGPGYCIRGEFSGNGFDNQLIHIPGVVSMARTGDPNSAGSQFFIMTSESPHLDGSYAAFGKVLDDGSMDTVMAIAKARTPRTEMARGKKIDEIFNSEGRPVAVHQGNADCPLDTMRMLRVTVDTFGEEYPEAEKIHK